MLTDVSAVLPSSGYTRLNTHVNSSTQRACLHHGTFFLHHWTRGLLLVVHQVSIDSVHRWDWTQVGGPFSRTPHRYHQREEWPFCTCPLQPTNHTLEDMKVAVLKAGLANQENRKKQEMRLIFKYGTVGSRGLNQDFSFTWITPPPLLFFWLTRAP